MHGNQPRPYPALLCCAVMALLAAGAKAWAAAPGAAATPSRGDAPASGPGLDLEASASPETPSDGQALSGRPAQQDPSEVIIYQPKRTSENAEVRGARPAATFDRERFSQETKALWDNPGVRQLMEMRLQGTVINADMPLTAEQREALQAVRAFNQRWPVRQPPPPPPPPPPLPVLQ